MQISWAHLVIKRTTQFPLSALWLRGLLSRSGPDLFVFLMFTNVSCYLFKRDYTSMGSGCLPEISRWRKLPLSSATMESRQRQHREVACSWGGCLQRRVTRQLGSSGDYGGCISKWQGTTYLLFPHCWIFIHIFIRVGGITKSLYLDRRPTFKWWSPSCVHKLCVRNTHGKWNYLHWSLN